jgi:putative transposase
MRDIVRRRWAARSMHGKTGRPATRRNVQALVLRLARENPEWATAKSPASRPAWE